MNDDELEDILKAEQLLANLAGQRRAERRRMPDPFEPLVEFSATLDYDILQLVNEEKIVSVTGNSITDIGLWPNDFDEKARIRVFQGPDRSLIVFDFVDVEEAKAFHAHLHNLWRDARIVAGRAK